MGLDGPSTSAHYFSWELFYVWVWEEVGGGSHYCCINSIPLNRARYGFAVPNEELVAPDSLVRVSAAAHQ